VLRNELNATDLDAADSVSAASIVAMALQESVTVPATARNSFYRMLLPP
jgi:hypothetical protein